MYHRSFGTRIFHEKYVYTKLCKSAKKSKIRYFSSHRNKTLVVLEYLSKNIEKSFHICNPGNIIMSNKYTTQYVINVINSMVKPVNSMEQGTIGLQDNFIELENERLKQSICIDQLIQENISTFKKLRQVISF